ncbi:GNAT family N-acetyltransferase [Mesorhizobium sp. M1217]|uniref:GNAT family N-acetyltransferase n=1 Tax=Mesorhizobium sp. M1217 TaxID=2957070 RepID=UPI00333E180D
MHILETQRLILRPPSHSDELLLHGLHSDPFVVNAVMKGVYPTLEQSKAELLHLINHWQRNPFGLWIVFVKDEGQARKFAGYCGLRCIDPDLPADPNNVEFVTRLHLAASGKGIGVEAGRVVVKFAFEHLKLDKVNSFILPNNTRSILMCVKIGFFYLGDVIYNNVLMKYFVISPGTLVEEDSLLVWNTNNDT